MREIKREEGYIISVGEDVQLNGGVWAHVR